MKSRKSSRVKVSLTIDRGLYDRLTADDAPKLNWSAVAEAALEAVLHGKQGSKVAELQQRVKFLNSLLTRIINIAAEVGEEPRPAFHRT